MLTQLNFIMSQSMMSCSQSLKISSQIKLFFSKCGFQSIVEIFVTTLLNKASKIFYVAMIRLFFSNYYVLEGYKINKLHQNKDSHFFLQEYLKTRLASLRFICTVNMIKYITREFKYRADASKAIPRFIYILKSILFQLCSIAR